MADYQSTNRTHSLARPADAQFLPRTSHYSHQTVAGSTNSWVHAQQNPSGPPLPQPVNLPSPVNALRPLPNPYPPNHGRMPGALHVVNTEPFGTEDSDVASASASPQDFNIGVVRPRKKKSFVGGFVKGFRRLPRMFRAPERNKPMRQGTSDTDGTSSSATGMTTGNTLPLYTSNPVTPITAPGPSGLHVSYRPPMVLSEPTIPESPPPAVVRISDTQRKHHPSFRVAPPLDSFEPEEHSELFSRERHRFEESLPSEGSVSSNPAERTTVMLYNERESQYYGRNSHAPTPAPAHPGVEHQFSSPGLSYVSEPLILAPVRPASFHSTYANAPAPIEIPQRVPTPVAPAPRVSYALQAPPQREAPQAVIPGAFPVPPPPQAQPQAEHIPQSTPHHVEPPPLPLVEAIQSPVTAHPAAAPDYLKMTLSPPPTSRNTMTTGTSFFRDPSFTSDLSPVERFFKRLYNMPWVSHDRVTVDYLPGEGLGKMRKRKFRPMSSWYKSMISRSRRSSATLDLLSSGTGTEASPHTSLGTSVALAFGPPLSGSRRSRRSSDQKRIVHHKSHHHHSSSRHHRHHTHSSHRRRRNTATTVDTTDTEALEKYGNPLIPAVYPFQYPSYPYQTFPTFSMPANVAAIPAQGLGHASDGHAGEHPVSPHGPRGEQQQQQQHQHQQPMMYAPAGYAPYQPMMAPPQMYVLHPASSPAQTNTSVPPALVPGGHGGQSHNLPVASQSQTIPGSF